MALDLDGVNTSTEVEEPQTAGTRRVRINTYVNEEEILKRTTSQIKLRSSNGSLKFPREPSVARFLEGNDR